MYILKLIMFLGQHTEGNTVPKNVFILFLTFIIRVKHDKAYCNIFYVDFLVYNI